MDYILKSRGQGKTYDLIIRSSKTKERIICANEMMAKLLEDRAKVMGYDIPKPVSCNQLVDGLMRDKFKNEEFLIDELRMVLKSFFGIKINAVTDTPNFLIVDTKDNSNNPNTYRY